jgi:hypothetical protein
MINLINVTSQETDDHIRNIEQQVTQMDEIIDTLKNELMTMQRKLATLQRDFNFSELFDIYDNENFECKGDSRSGTL